MGKRKSISKKIRFEVLKRDSFKCQYCGAIAPDVFLEIDHIKPIAKGGTNEITNLIVSCQDCNSGKGMRELSDKSVLNKQHKQLEELSDRRNQLKMMVEWREEIENISAVELEAVVNAIGSYHTGFGPNETGKDELRKWIKKYGVKDVLEATQTSFTQYIKRDSDQKVTVESWEKAWSYIPRIINFNNSVMDNPDLKDMLYIRGIVRNRFYNVDERQCIDLLKQCRSYGASIESLRECSKTFSSWTGFRDMLIDYTVEHGALD